MPNKLQYGVSNVYIAPITAWDATTGEPTFSTPVHLPGAVNLTLSHEGDLTKFYADNGVYWTGDNNNGYSGSLEVALIPSWFKEEILGQERDSKNVLYENEAATGQHFAMMFQFEGDAKATRHIMYNCAASRPDVNGETKNENLEPGTETINIEAASIPVEVATDTFKNIVKSSTDDTTDAATYNSWFNAVYLPSGAPAATT